MTAGTMADAGQANQGRDWPWRRVILASVLVILAAFYFSGRLDYTLYPLGLNFHPCARNGIGATFCGSDLTQYEQRWRGFQRQVRGMAIAPIRPLPGATAAEWGAYDSALASYCRLNPNGSGC